MYRQLKSEAGAERRCRQRMNVFAFNFRPIQSFCQLSTTNTFQWCCVGLSIRVLALVCDVLQWCKKLCEYFSFLTIWIVRTSVTQNMEYKPIRSGECLLWAVSSLSRYSSRLNSVYLDKSENRDDNDFFKYAWLENFQYFPAIWMLSWVGDLVNALYISSQMLNSLSFVLFDSWRLHALHLLVLFVESFKCDTIALAFSCHFSVGVIADPRK